MRFYKDNLISQEHEVEPEQAAKAFWTSSYGTSVQEGEVRMERALLLFLSDKYGSFDVREEASEYDALLEAVVAQWPEAVQPR